MYVVTRSGKREKVCFDKVLQRLEGLSAGLAVDPALVAQKTFTFLVCGITTEELDLASARTAAYMCVTHPDYSRLAARVLVSNLHRNTHAEWARVVDELDANGQISLQYAAAARRHAPAIQGLLDYSRDFAFDYFGFMTLQGTYLLRSGGRVLERPQHLYMREAIGIHLGPSGASDDAAAPDAAAAALDMVAVAHTYSLLSTHRYTHATPTMFNAGTPLPQLASCFLLPVADDSIRGMYGTLLDCALISKNAGGIGLAVSHVRAQGSLIRGTGGHSNGLVPMARVYNDCARHVDQGGGKRKGAFAVYLEPWHADIFDFLELRKNTGPEEARARDLFYGLWVPDLFMRRLDEDGPWALFCPNEVLPVALQELHGAAFEAAYTALEATNKARRVVRARDLMTKICEAQMETGMPYMLYKDAANAKSNHRHLGTIQCSNLCTEIIEYSAPGETASCNLASLSLPAFVRPDGSFDYAELRAVTADAVVAVNRVIDSTYYPLPSIRASNMRHRPIGLGVQGLADVFFKMGLPFTSPGARAVNRRVFKAMYYAAARASVELARQHGPYGSFPGSPASEGLLQPHLWGVDPAAEDADLGLDWDALVHDVRVHGMRNSLLIAPMPTASTAQILGNTECFEAQTSNVFTRRVLSGEYIVVNRYLVEELTRLGVWGEATRDAIMRANGSVQGLDIPAAVKEVFRTVWEIPQRDIIAMAADRGPYIDQSQSLNLYMEAPSFGKLNGAHMAAWRAGLKTGMYYLRSKPAAAPLKSVLSRPVLSAAAPPPMPQAPQAVICTDEVCTMCSS